MRKNSIIIWVLAILVMFAAAYTAYAKYSKYNSSVQPQNQTSSQAQSSSQTQGISQEKQKVTAPDFTLKDLNGKDVKLSDYRGKIVILNFWAVWCKYCKIEMPDLDELNKELAKGKDAVILEVDVQESKDTVKNYFNENNITLNSLLDTDGSVTQMYGITGFPTTFIINRDGSVYTYIPGLTDKATLTGIINSIK